MTREYRQTVYAPPAGAVDLLLIRHGESQPARPGEPFPHVDGQGDPALHPEGEAQAHAVGTRLKGEPLAAIYVTTLRRTHQTAAPLAAHLGLAPLVEPDLREVFLGDWDRGEYRIRAANDDPAFLRARERQEWGEIPGAETTAQLHARVRAGLLRIAARHPDQRIAAFVHGGVIGAAMAMASGAEPFAFHGAANGSISRLVIQGERMVVRGFNDVAHLS
ncbi:histidine phosphatase family protein [Ruegeria pomeroyi]|uniref:Phosphoglycerate mutase family protein n=2 Tax=Ruegeria pomeroyi TaxID=89184 RepID=Q5LS00_RUEPO|nr:histidine phosphatase family protein [Ruegeria pomeroyi]AAV95246.1 phosphoglycerate mutase family protein [Ruegeria pomeroyi DSS-3]NVK97402.1 histidine phosphatase family protein [Ruegeria pomeroyi]NVL01656.1 histidine phosphatase family protein [Ruegeria pomeroyi]QWV08818.1 histidine phosphatase family protein [Ruegeria pomeroyi]